MLYNQNKQKETFYACSVYSYLNALRYDFGVELEDTIILKIVKYMSSIGALQKWGAYASVIFIAMDKYVYYKTGLKVETKKTTINYIKPDDGYILGFKSASKSYIDVSKDGKVTNGDLNTIKASTKTYGHFHYYKRGKVVETLGGYAYDMSLDTIKKARDMDLYYSSVRYIVPADHRTKVAQRTLVEKAKMEKRFIGYEELMKIDFK